MIVRPYDRTPPPLTQVDLNDDINDKLVGAWLLNDRSGRAHDSSLYRRHASLTNFASSPYTGNPRGGHALTFDGTNDVVNLPSTFSFGLRPLSIAGWSYCVNNSQQAFFSSVDSGANGFYFSTFAANQLYAAYYNGTFRGIAAATALPTGRWFPWALTQDTTAGTILYVDGFSRNTNADLNAGVAMTTWQVGAQFGWAVQHNGAHFGTRVWNRAITPREVLRLARDPFTGFRAPRRLASFKAAAGGGAALTHKRGKWIAHADTVFGNVFAWPGYGSGGATPIALTHKRGKWIAYADSIFGDVFVWPGYGSGGATPVVAATNIGIVMICSPGRLMTR